MKKWMSLFIIFLESLMDLNFNLKMKKCVQMFSSHKVILLFYSCHHCITFLNEALLGYLPQVILIWRCSIKFDLALPL